MAKEQSSGIVSCRILNGFNHQVKRVKKCREAIELNEKRLSLRIDDATTQLKDHFVSLFVIEREVSARARCETCQEDTGRTERLTKIRIEEYLNTVIQKDQNTRRREMMISKVLDFNRSRANVQHRESKRAKGKYILHSSIHYHGENRSRVIILFGLMRRKVEKITKINDMIVEETFVTGDHVKAEEVYVLTYKYRKVTKQYNKQEKNSGIKVKRGDSTRSSHPQVKEKGKSAKPADKNKPQFKSHQDNPKYINLTIRSWNSRSLNGVKAEYIEAQSEDIVCIQEEWRPDQRALRGYWDINEREGKRGGVTALAIQNTEVTIQKNSGLTMTRCCIGCY